MFSFFSRKKDKTEEVPKDTQSETTETTEIVENEDGILDTDSQIAWMKKNKWVSDEFDIDKKNILIMDDRHEIISSVIDDLRSLDESVLFDLNDFNIISVSTKMAGFYVLDILEKAPDVEIHFALLDIILGGKRVIDGKRKMVDGVDVALKIYEEFPEAEVIFFSGCIIEDSNDPTHFKNKFDTNRGEDLRNHIMAKDISFEDELKQLSTFFNGY